MLDENKINALLENIENGTYGYEQALADVAAAQLGEEVRAAMYAAVYIIYHYGVTSATHAALKGREEPEQHPISAIKDLAAELQKRNNPQSLPCPQPVVFTGAVNKTYNGTERVEVPVVLGSPEASEIHTEISADVADIADAAPVRPINVIVHGKNTLSAEPSFDAPADVTAVGSDGVAEISIYGKNILKTTADTQTSDGVTFTVLSDGRIRVNGTATEDGKLSVHDYCSFPPGEKMMLSGCPVGGSTDTFHMAVYDSTWYGLAKDTGCGAEFVVPDNGTIHVRIRYTAGTVFNGEIFKPMIRPAAIIDSEFEEYRKTPLRIAIPAQLNGVPVSSGGNYTDMGGRQWVTDDVDAQTGVYTQRVLKTVYTGAASEGWYLQTENNGLYLFISQIKLPLANESKDYLCTHARPGSTSINAKNAGSYVYNGTLRLCVPGEVATTEAQLNRYLADNPMTLLCPSTEENMLLIESSEDELGQITMPSPNAVISQPERAGVTVIYAARPADCCDSLSAGENMLHNASFEDCIINQRNHTGEAVNTYCVDRWIANGSVVPAAGRHISVTAGTSLMQRLEIIPDTLTHKQFAFGIKTGGNIETAAIAFPRKLTDAPNIVDMSCGRVELGFTAGEIELCGVKCQAVPYIKFTAAADMNIRRMRLEAGGISHIGVAGPVDIGAELLRCQRYAVRYGGDKLCYPCIAVARNATTGTMIINLPCQMRLEGVTATITGTPTVRVGDVDSGVITTIGTARNAPANAFWGSFTAPNGNMSSGTTYIVRMEGGTSILISADL